MIQFTKYQAAGNTYIIVKNSKVLLSSTQAQLFCNPILGVGSDGIICWKKDIALSERVYATIFNPDGSQAEKSGNGLRILATYLFEHEFSNADSLVIETLNSTTKVIRESNGEILLEMGMVVPQFNPKVLTHHMINESQLTIETPLGFIKGYAVAIGNPHFVTFQPKITKEDTKNWGPLIENHSIFPNRTNVQFAHVESRDVIRAEIWERGAGYTLSSGSSSCAIAAVAHNLGYCDSTITVKMAGGNLRVTVNADNSVLLRGPVSKVVDGVAYIA